MRIRLLVRAFFLISFFTMKAQENLSVNMNLKTEPTDQIDFTESDVKISLSKKINNKNKITNTLAYSNLKVNYELERIEEVENITGLNQIQNRFEFLHTFTNTTNLNFSVSPMVNFQRNINSTNFSLLGSFEINQELNSKITIRMGLARATYLGNAKFLPTLLLHYKVNDKSNAEIGFPDSKISYSNNSRNMFSLSNSFNGNFYNVDQQNSFTKEASKVTLSQMTSALEYERNVDKNWFLNFKAGYDFDKKYSITDQNNHKIHDFNTGNGFVLGVGIKYKQQINFNTL